MKITRHKRKFTVDQVRQIRASGITCEKLAEAYATLLGEHVSHVAIWKIKQGRTYKWVAPE